MKSKILYIGLFVAHTVISGCTQNSVEAGGELDGNSCPSLSSSSCGQPSQTAIECAGSCCGLNSQNSCSDVIIPLSYCHYSNQSLPQTPNSPSLLSCGTGWPNGTRVTALTNPCWCTSGVIGCPVNASYNALYDCTGEPVCTTDNFGVCT